MLSEGYILRSTEIEIPRGTVLRERGLQENISGSELRELETMKHSGKSMSAAIPGPIAIRSRSVSRILACHTQQQERQQGLTA